MPNPPERTGPGQSGATAGQSYFDERIPGAMEYPSDGVPQGSRSTLPAELDPEPRVQPPDDRLREMVVAALRDDASGLDVRVKAGAVALAGRVADDVAKREIEYVVRRVPGVKAVDNLLEVHR